MIRLPIWMSRILVRAVFVSAGFGAIVWAMWSIPAYRAEAGLASITRGILSGERYGPAQLAMFRRTLDGIPHGRLRALALNNKVVLHLRLVESAMAMGNLSSEELAGFEREVIQALSGSPTNSFLWLVRYWIDRQRNGALQGNPALLRASYALAPNEAWIAARRNPLAVGTFAGLPDDLMKAVLVEFSAMVRDGLYPEAANVIAIADKPVREQLLGRVAGLPELNRRRLAFALDAKQLDDIVVPGVDRKPKRPF